MAYRLIIEMTDGSKINKCYEHEEFATNLYAMALFKKLAKYASVIDTSNGDILFEFGTKKELA